MRAVADEFDRIALAFRGPRLRLWRWAGPPSARLQDESTIAYLGELKSGAAAISSPILNEAGIFEFSAATRPSASRAWGRRARANRSCRRGCAVVFA